MPKNMIDDLVAASPNRRSFLKTIGVATAAVGAMSVAGVRGAEAQTNTELEVLNFALNLEYLEAEFYTYAVYGNSITSHGLEINGVANPGNPSAGGTTTGGSKVDFSNSLVFTQAIAEEIGSDERAHVALLRGLLGSHAIAKPNLDLNALGFGFGNQNDFLRLSRIFEDVGVSAYAGAAGLLSTPAVITYAARILAAEAEHVSTVRTQIARLNITTSKLDDADLISPPSGAQTQYLSINVSNGLPATRTPGEVLYLAYGGVEGASKGGFFPTGTNGAFTMSTGPATAANLS
jgi:Ferritin-like domain